VDSLADTRIHYHRNEARLGIAQNWESLIEAARGQFLLLLMDDDLLEPTFLERCLTEFDRDPELAVVFTNHTFVEGERRRVRRCDIGHGRHDACAELMLKHRPAAISGTLWRASVWPSIRPLPRTAAADMVIFGRIADLDYPFCYIDEPLMHYRVHSDNYSAGRPFRDDKVVAWESLTMRHPAARRERDQRLAEALLSRATAELREGDRKAAGADAARARRLTAHRSMFALAIQAVAAHESLAAVARAAADAKAFARARNRRNRWR
jgi:hypothetical protein